MSDIKGLLKNLGTPTIIKKQGLLNNSELYKNMKWTDRLTSLILGEQTRIPVPPKVYNTSDEAVRKSIESADRVAKATTGKQPSTGLKLLRLAVGDKTKTPQQKSK